MGDGSIKVRWEDGKTQVLTKKTLYDKIGIKSYRGFGFSEKKPASQPRRSTSRSPSRSRSNSPARPLRDSKYDGNWYETNQGNYLHVENTRETTDRAKRCHGVVYRTAERESDTNVKPFYDSKSEDDWFAYETGQNGISVKKLKLKAVPEGALPFVLTESNRYKMRDFNRRRLIERFIRESERCIK